MDSTRTLHPLNFKGISRAALPHLPLLLNRWLPGGKTLGNEYLAKNPKRPDQRPGSFKINVRTGRWADFATGDRGGDPISLYAYLFDVGQGKAACSLAEIVGCPHE